MKQDIIIIGAGIIGLATAERLLTQGAKVMVIERNKIGQESSWAGGGILSPLCPWDYSDAVTQLTSYSAMKFPAWTSVLQDTTGIDPEYETNGMLILPPYNSKAAHHWCSVRRIRKELRAVPEITPIENIFEIDKGKNHKHALFLPDVAQVRNPRLLKALRKRIIQLGGSILENCTVHQLKTAHRQIQLLTSSCGDFAADDYIICAGAWSKPLLKIQKIELSIKPIKGQVLLFKFDVPPLHSILMQDGLYIIPRRDGHLLIGSTLEDVGFNKQPTTSARKYLLTRAQAILPLLHKMPIIQQWAGLRPASLNNLPTIGKHPMVDNLFANCGHFRYGLTMAPASAEILVNEIMHAPQPFDIAPYQAGWHLS